MDRVTSASEIAARALLVAVPQWREALERAGRKAKVWASLCAEIERRARLAHGLEAGEGDAAVAALVAASALSDAVWRDEHVLGWFHQGWASVERSESFRAYDEDKRAHSSVLEPTQLYTPRWIADWMAQGALALVPEGSGGAPSCVDPAMGGGQLLLAWLGALEARGAGWSALELARSVHGVELDPRACEAARRGIALWLERRFGALDARVSRVLRAQLVVGDGLVRGAQADVALSNPPYMGLRAMPPALRATLAASWAPYHTDLCAAFVSRCHRLARCGVGLLIQQSFWYLSRYEAAREALEGEGQLRAFVHLGSRVFAALTGEKASVVASVHAVGAAAAGESARFLDLRELDGEEAAGRLGRWAAGAAVARAYEAAPESFSILPGRPLAYWLPGPLRARFADGARLGEVAWVPGALNKTSDNGRFVRRWDAVEAAQRADAPGLLQGVEGGRWRFYSKGGRYAPWWGSWEHVVDWSEQARAFYASQRTASLMEARWWGVEGLCYTDFGGARFNARWLPAGCICDMTGPGIFVALEDEEARRRRLYALLAVLNSAPARMMLNALNPTLHYQVRDVRNLPLPELSGAAEAALAEGAQALVEGWRGVHGWAPGDPRHGLVDGEDWRARVAELERAEAALQARVCALYGVEELAGGALPQHRLVAELERAFRVES